MKQQTKMMRNHEISHDITAAFWNVECGAGLFWNVDMWSRLILECRYVEQVYFGM
jgi:hypothetical protein